MTTYTQLQVQAKELGIKANQSADVLRAEITKAIAEKSKPKAKSTGSQIKDGQLRYLTDLRKRFNIDLTGIESLTFREANQEISELAKRPLPASIFQLEKVQKLLLEMKEMGAKINISEEKLASLTGGKEGTASKMIAFLQNKTTEIKTLVNVIIQLQEAGFTDEQVFENTQELAGMNASMMPFIAQQRGKRTIEAVPTDGQVDTVAEWYLCPDIPFEDYSITKRIMLPDFSATAWRYMTPEEFKEEIRASISRTEISRMIEKYRGAFYEWKQQRITPAQIKHIRTLEQRLANMESQAEVTYGIDLEGNVVEVSTAKKNTYNPRAHEPMSEQQLQQLSIAEAKKLIDQMSSESSRTYNSIDSSKSQQHLQEKVQKFSERTGTGYAKTQSDAMSVEYQKLSDLVFKLEAVAGQQNEELHELIKETLLHGGGNVEHVKQELKSFMHLTVDRQNKRRAINTSSQLLQITEDTEFGSAVAELVVDEVIEEFSRPA